MTTIEIPVEEPLLAEIDRTARGLALTREAFIQVTLRRAIQRKRRLALELRDREGYLRQPQAPDEAEEWMSMQGWGDE
jgi:metal-responsive CopG/Arc/MetJ family transcriptional regulator